MAESHIDTRTGEEMLQQAYDRIIKIGDLVTAHFKHDYIPMAEYWFDFDARSIYHFHGRSKDGWFFYFRRNSDMAMLTMTKYSSSPTLMTD